MKVRDRQCPARDVTPSPHVTNQRCRRVEGWLHDTRNASSTLAEADLREMSNPIGWYDMMGVVCAAPFLVHTSHAFMPTRGTTVRSN